MVTSGQTPEQVVLAAVGRPSLGDALAWIAEDNPLPADTDWPRLLRAAVAVSGHGDLLDRALRRIVAEVSRSDVDPATMIFQPDAIVDPSIYRECLSLLAKKNPGGSLRDLQPHTVVLAQRENPKILETLCLVAGIAYRDLRDRHHKSDTPWTRAAILEAFAEIDRVIRGDAKSDIPGALPARPLELLCSATGGDEMGWGAVEQMRAGGVPYEALLGQRAVGSAWNAHRNRTSSQVNYATAQLLCDELTARDVHFRRSSVVGGEVSPAVIRGLVGSDKRVGLVALRETKPTFAVAFSTAKDGGTARTNGDSLLQMAAAKVPLAIVLAGAGWASRVETVRLAKKYDGRLFSDRTIGALADLITSEGGS